jgi:hypothetical protein
MYTYNQYPKDRATLAIPQAFANLRTFLTCTFSDAVGGPSQRAKRVVLAKVHANGGQLARAELTAPAFAGLTLEKSELSPSAMVG